VIVTGAAGMLGSALVRSLVFAAEHEVVGLTRRDLDLRDKNLVLQKFSDLKPDAVIHCAAKVGGIQANISNPVDFLASNLEMDTNVITSCLSAGVNDFVYLGSSCMYPKDFRQPLKESDILAASLEPTNEGYALAKIVGSKLCEYASASLGVNYKTIIPSSLYGPGDNFSPGTGHLLASVIRKVAEAKMSKSTLIDVWGSGNARREFTYVEDLANWLSSRLDQLASFPPVLNVGVGVDYSVNEFYEAAKRVMGVEAQLDHDLSKPEGMRAKLMDSSLASAGFGWTAPTKLEDGIGMTLKWLTQRETER